MYIVLEILGWRASPYEVNARTLVGDIILTGCQVCVEVQTLLTYHSICVLAYPSLTKVSMCVLFMSHNITYATLRSEGNLTGIHMCGVIWASILQHTTGINVNDCLLYHNIDVHVKILI
jgi:hypothetical protein